MSLDALTPERTSDAYVCIGTSYLFTWDRDFDLALGAFTSAVEANPNNAGAYHQLGKLHYAKGDWQAAIDAFGKAIELAPQEASNYGLRCAAYVNGGLVENFQQAIADCTRNLQDSPDWAWGYYYIGVAHKQLGNEEEAIDYLEHALALFESGTWANPEMATNVRGLLDELRI